MLLYNQRHLESLRDHKGVDDAFEAVFVLIPFLAALAFGISAFIFAMMSRDANADAAMNEKLQQYYLPGPAPGQTEGQDTKENRRRLAQEVIERVEATKLLESMDIGASVQVYVPYFEKIQEMAANGEAIRLDTDRMHWDAYWKLWTKWWFIGIWLMACSFIALCFYGYHSGERNRMIVNLNWSRPSTWMWVLITGFNPAGPIAYLVSLVEYHKAVEKERIDYERVQAIAAELLRERFETIERVRAINDAANADCEVSFRRNINAEVDPLRVTVDSDWVTLENDSSLESDPEAVEAARSLFVTYLSEQAGIRHQDRLERARSEKGYQEGRLRELGTAIRDAQSQLQNATVRLRQLEETTDNTPVSAEQLDLDFKALSEMKGVKKVYVRDGMLCVFVRAVRHYEGHDYDMGDWELGFNSLYHRRLTCTKLRSATRRDWVGGAPDYTWGGGLCFGNADDIITENLADGHVIQAFAVAIRTIHNVNDQDEINIPRAFRKVRYATQAPV